jgi:hypothetical protein
VGSAQEFLEDLLKHLQFDPEFVCRRELKGLLINTLEASKLGVNNETMENLNNLISACLHLPEHRGPGVALDFYRAYQLGFEKEVLDREVIDALEAVFS